MPDFFNIWTITKEAGRDFLKDDALAYGAALAFYTALSFAPLVLLFITIGGLLGDTTRNDLIDLFSRQLGPQAGGAVENVIENAQTDHARSGSGWRWFVSIGMLLFSASAVFAQLQNALNHIWGVEAKPGAGIGGWIRKRLLSVGMIFAILFILLVALVISMIIDQLIPGEGSDWIGKSVTALVSFVVIMTFFGLLFKVLPDVQSRWRDVMLGAFVTALLFTVGQLVLGEYLARANVGGSYGGASESLIALLVWTYYSALIFFFGAEITERYAHHAGSKLTPDEHARWEDAATEDSE